MGFAGLVESIFVMTGVAHLCATVFLSIDAIRGKRIRPGAAVSDPIVCFGVAAAAAVLAGYEAATVTVVAAAAILITVVITRMAVRLRTAGTLAWVSLLASTATGTIVGLIRLPGLSLDPISLVLVWLIAAVAILRTPSSVMQLFESWEVALRRSWRRSLEPVVNWTMPSDPPLVTIEVPTYAEPPEIVIATLEALARLDYPNYNVLVIDNNTRDESLWRPVEAHCARLGPTFRFVHVEGITGAKAGALNWSRPYLEPRTELVALVDADYQVDPQWLAHTVGFFDDPRLGFVQCPHAYRHFQHSAYGRMANAGYQWAQVTEMVSRNEHDAGITIGTMSLIRLEALDAAGGWAEWCQTEDSEFAIRAHAAGYSSVFLNRPYGRGLIPETLAELKKQRFRWTYGPGQEFKNHARLYLPGGLRRPSALTRQQRIRHGHYGLVILTTGFGVLSLPISLAVLAIMFVRHAPPILAPTLLMPFGAMIIGRRIMRWTLFKFLVGVGFAEFVGGCIALLAVKPAASTAAFSVLIGKGTRWQRTNKFRVPPDKFRYLYDARTEIILAGGCLATVAAILLALPVEATTLLFALGFCWQAVVYACAPLMAILAERGLRTLRLPLGHSSEQRTDNTMPFSLTR